MKNIKQVPMSGELEKLLAQYQRSKADRVLAVYEDMIYPKPEIIRRKKVAQMFNIKPATVSFHVFYCSGRYWGRAAHEQMEPSKCDKVREIREDNTRAYNYVR